MTTKPAHGFPGTGFCLYRMIVQHAFFQHFECITIYFLDMRFTPMAQGIQNPLQAPAVSAQIAFDFRRHLIGDNAVDDSVEILCLLAI